VGRLRARGIPTTVLVRRRHALPREILEGVESGDLRVFVGGLDDLARLREVLRGARACVHLATGGGATWEEIEENMVRASLRVAEAARCEKLSRLVYVSSIAALYTGRSAGTRIADSLATDPRPEERAPYARGKIATEKALVDFQRERPVGLVIARPGVVLGAGTPLQHSGFGLWVRDNHCVAGGRGEHALPVVLVGDVAEALVRAAVHEGSELDGRAMNLATRAPLSAAGLVQEMAQVSGRRFVFHPRPLWWSQAMEIGKWIVKRVGGRKDAPFPSYRDIDSRALAPSFECETARELLGWQPLEERNAVLQALREAWAPSSPEPPEPSGLSGEQVRDATLARRG
jgi:nucleoside-diphosphate-sugar epimerase